MTTYTKDIGDATVVASVLGDLEVRVTASDIDCIRVSLPGWTMFIKVETVDALCWAMQEAAAKVREELEPIQF